MSIFGLNVYFFGHVHLFFCHFGAFFTARKKNLVKLKIVKTKARVREAAPQLFAQWRLRDHANDMNAARHTRHDLPGILYKEKLC